MVRLLAEHRWPFRLHATYDESITPLPRRVRGGQPRRAVRRPALVLRPRRDGLGAEPGAGQGAGRRHRRAAPHGLPGRVLHRPLRGRRRPEHSPPIAQDAGDGHPGRGRDRRHPRGELQPVGVAVLAGRRQDGRRHAAVPRGEPPGPQEALRRYTAGQRLVLGRRGQRRAPSRPASWRTSRCCRRTTSRSPRRRSRASSRCSRWSAARSSTGPGEFAAAGPAAPAGRSRTGRRSRCTAATTGRPRGTGRSRPALRQPGLLHQLLHAWPTGQPAPRRGAVWGLGCECFAF